MGYNGWHDGTYTVCIDYLNEALIPKMRAATIKRTVRQLKKHADKFDAIAVCGVSGMLIGVPVADKLGKPLIVVRKGDVSHSGLRVEGSLEGRYIIIDDLVCTGSTILTIVSSIKTQHNQYAECVGIYLYWGRVYSTNWAAIEIMGDEAAIPGIPNSRWLKKPNKLGQNYAWL